MADNDWNDDEFAPASKSQLKREATHLQELGAALLQFHPKQLAPLNLPEKLIDALKEGRRLTAHGAIARHKQYIGKLMRNVDPEPIQAFMDALNGVSDTHNAWLHQIERLREKMLTDANAVQAFIDEHPAIEIQRLRQIVRNAQKERQQMAEGKQVAPKAYRELFQLIKAEFKEPPLPGLPPVEEENEE